MTPIEASFSGDTESELRDRAIESDQRLIYTQALILMDLLSHDITPSLLRQRYDKATVRTRGGIKALQVGGEIFPIESIVDSPEEVVVIPCVILPDGSRHEIVETPNNLKIAIWSYPDREGIRHPFANEFESRPVIDFLQFNKGKTDSTVFPHQLSGPEGIALSSRLYNNVSLWDINPPSFKSDSAPATVWRQMISSFYDLVLDTYAK